MISWRWPRPIAVIASIAVMPVYSGSFTGWRETTLGAWSSSGPPAPPGRGPEGPRGLRGDRALVVDRAAEGVDHPAEEAVTDRHRQDAPGLLDRVALLDRGGLAEDDAADLGLVQVERDAEQAAGELQQLVGHRARESRHPGDAVTGLDDAADLLAVDGRRPALDVLAKGRGDGLGIDQFRCHGSAPECEFGVLEAARDRAVEDEVVDARDHAADHGCVDDDLCLDGAAGRLGQRLLQALALLVGKGDRRPDLGHGVLTGAGREADDGVGDLRQVACAA